MVRLTDRPDMTLDVYDGRKTTIQQQQQPSHVPIFTSYASNLMITRKIIKSQKIFQIELYKSG